MSKEKKNVEALDDEAVGNVSGGQFIGPIGPINNTGRQRKITPDMIAKWEKLQKGKK